MFVKGNKLYIETNMSTIHFYGKLQKRTMNNIQNYHLEEKRKISNKMINKSYKFGVGFLHHCFFFTAFCQYLLPTQGSPAAISIALTSPSPTSLSSPSPSNLELASELPSSPMSTTSDEEVPSLGPTLSEVRGEEPPCVYCPHFLDTPNMVNTSRGADAKLTCGVNHLGDRKVSWIRKSDLHVLTTGDLTYTTDSRFQASHLDGSPYWMLLISKVKTQDAGIYECQVSTLPKIFSRFSLNVRVPEAHILGSRDMYMRAGSNINITCEVTGAVAKMPVIWYHHRSTTDRTPNEAVNIGSRGGVQVITDHKRGSSWLLVTRVTSHDAGNYTCAPKYATPASVVVHVVEEEEPAAMQHDLPSPSAAAGTVPDLIFVCFTLVLLQMYWIQAPTSHTIWKRNSNHLNQGERVSKFVHMCCLRCYKITRVYKQYFIVIVKHVLYLFYKESIQSMYKNMNIFTYLYRQFFK
ncbi:unnamed protein product, partial [Meganyctiphanes norvegica]